jgi:hypothetical protein
LQRGAPEVIPIRLVEELVVVGPGDPVPPPALGPPAGLRGRRVIVRELVVVWPGDPVRKADE